MRSISSTLAQATDQASALSLIIAASRSRLLALMTFESAMPAGTLFPGVNITAAA